MIKIEWILEPISCCSLDIEHQILNLRILIFFFKEMKMQELMRQVRKSRDASKCNGTARRGFMIEIELKIKSLNFPQNPRVSR